MTMTWDELAGILGYPTREFRRWRKEAGAPITTDVESWRAFLTAKGKRDDAGNRDVVAADADLPGDCDYDKLVKAGKLTYALAKTREQVISEKIANDIKQIERAKASGALVAKEDAEAAAALVRDRTEQRYDRAIKRALADVASAWPAEMPAEVRDKILKAVDTALDAD